LPNLGFVPAVEQQVADSISARGLLREGDTVLVAVSGGIDSIVLLHLLHSLSSAHRWKLIVAHFNHRLRGRASDADAKLVERTSISLGLPCECGAADVKAFATARKLSTEMAARELRHAFLAETSAKFGANTIAVAHHADDQVELFLLRLLRGSSTLGLGGMHWTSPSPSRPSVMLIRPLLNITKRDIRSYAKTHSLKFREDATNASTDILRNRIRHNLLPLLRRHYQAGIDEVLLRQSDLLREDGDYLVKEAQRWLGLGAPSFANLSVALQRRVLHMRLLACGIDPDFALVEKLRLAPQTWISVSALKQCRATVAGEIETRAVAAESASSTDEALVVSVAAPDVVTFSGARLSWTRKRGSRVLRGKVGREVFDADAIGERIVLRHWRPGDRFQPIGMAKPVKLQDLFVNNKIPRLLRGKLVVAATASGELFWVEGLRISERFKMTANTKRHLQWTWRRLKESEPAGPQ
jgi:tRNA(Ile)-lysidine synthase